MTAFPFRKAHFIGLAGVGMSATAILLRDSGVAVTGSDEAIYPPISQVLAREAFACRAPYAAQNIPDDADLIVIGKNARLVPSENDEVAEAFARAARPGGPKILSFAEVLALLSRGHENIVVAGSFGKTTSVAMMAHCLANAGLDPSWMIGAVPLSPARASNAGTGRLFLLEGDEYPSSLRDGFTRMGTSIGLAALIAGVVMCQGCQQHVRRTIMQKFRLIVGVGRRIFVAFKQE